MSLSIAEVICSGIESVQLHDIDEEYEDDNGEMTGGEDVKKAIRYEEKGKYRKCATEILNLLDSNKATEDRVLIRMLLQVEKGSYLRAANRRTRKIKVRSRKGVPPLKMQGIRN
jgi:hypothetical protein